MEKACLLSLVQEIQTATNFKNYFNIHGKQKQSSVSLIMRISPQYQQKEQLYNQFSKCVKSFNVLAPEQNITSYESLQEILSFHQEIKFQGLFIQRALDPKDLHSGQLAFPGGHVDENENDFEAAIREVQEEIGFSLNQNSLYLGKLPKNFYARKTRKGEPLFTSLHLFLLIPTIQSLNLIKMEDKKQQEFPKFVLQEKEVRDAQWIDMKKFFEIERESIKIYRSTSSFNINMIPSIFRSQIQTARNYFKYGEFCSVEIGMDNVLWGLTFFFMCYILSLIRVSFKGDKEEIQKLSKISYLLTQSPHYNLVFEENYSFGRVINFITKQVHNKQRNQQFTYQTSQELQSIASKKRICLMIIGVLAASAVAYPIYRSAL